MRKEKEEQMKAAVLIQSRVRAWRSTKFVRFVRSFEQQHQLEQTQGEEPQKGPDEDDEPGADGGRRCRERTLTPWASHTPTALSAERRCWGKL